MSSSISNIVANIKDSELAMVKLPTMGGEHNQLRCIYKKSEAPYFNLVFQSDSLSESFNKNSSYPVAILQESSTLFLDASFVEMADERTLYMVANGTLDPAILREYFRVNTSTVITASYMRSSVETDTRDWTIHGQTQDLSGSGVLALFGGEPKNRDNIHIEIFLPNLNTSINAVGHVIRKKRLRSKRWQVSFHFDAISAKHRDAIISYLLSEQRKQLRNNVRTASF